MRDRIVVATTKSWDKYNFLQLKHRLGKQYDFVLVPDKRNLNFAYLQNLAPKYIFFPHWSWIIPDYVYNNCECIVFHMTDLPFGRGGSPLQNLILKGLKNTMISAIRVVKGLDAGPVYLKRSLSLHGSAEEIYNRASKKIFDKMIPYLLYHKPKAAPQKGKVVVFKRRIPEQSRIPRNISLTDLYDYIRMLDADGYPHAFIENSRFRIEFKNAELKRNRLEARITIFRKDKNG